MDIKEYFKKLDEKVDSLSYKLFESCTPKEKGEDDEEYYEIDYEAIPHKHGFTTLDGHLNLEFALEEIKMLYKVYGLEKEKNLTIDAIELKHKILYFVKQIKEL